MNCGTDCLWRDSYVVFIPTTPRSELLPFTIHVKQRPYKPGEVPALSSDTNCTRTDYTHNSKCDVCVGCARHVHTDRVAPRRWDRLSAERLLSLQPRSIVKGNYA